MPSRVSGYSSNICLAKYYGKNPWNLKTTVHLVVLVGGHLFCHVYYLLQILALYAAKLEHNTDILNAEFLFTSRMPVQTRAALLLYS
jgi:hypothetical protein